MLTKSSMIPDIKSKKSLKTWSDKVWNGFFFCFLCSWKVKVFGNARFSSGQQSLLWRARTEWHPKSLNDTSWWQCMFAHTHRRSLSLPLPGIHSKEHQPFLPSRLPPPWKILVCATHENIPRNQELYPFSKISL